MRIVPFIATYPDGSQVLVARTFHDDGVTTETVATRPHAAAVWGPPVELMLAPSERGHPE